MSKGGEKREERRYRICKRPQVRKNWQKAGVAAAQKEPTGGKPRMEYKARLCRALLAVLVILNFILIQWEGSEGS